MRKKIVIVLAGISAWYLGTMQMMLPPDQGYVQLNILKSEIQRYEMMHNGNLPKSLHDLVHQFRSEDSLLNWIYYRNTSQEWLYYYSPRLWDELPDDYILLASPVTGGIDSDSRETRQVAFLRKATIFIPESEYQERITKQVGNR